MTTDGCGTNEFRLISPRNILKRSMALSNLSIQGPLMLPLYSPDSLNWKLTVEPDVSDHVSLVYLGSLIKSPTVCYWRLCLSVDRNYQRLCLFEDRTRKVSILNEPMLLPIHVECLYKWRLCLKTMFVRGSNTPGPYLRGGVFGFKPPVGPIMLILTHYFNDNLRLKYPQKKPNNPPPKQKSWIRPCTYTPTRTRIHPIIFYVIIMISSGVHQNETEIKNTWINSSMSKLYRFSRVINNDLLTADIL